MDLLEFFWHFQRAVNQIYIFRRFTFVNQKLTFLLSYFVNEIMGNNFKTLVRYNSTLEHPRTKWTKNEFLMIILVNYIIFKKIKISVQRPLKHHHNRLITQLDHFSNSTPNPWTKFQGVFIILKLQPVGIHNEITSRK